MDVVSRSYYVGAARWRQSLVTLVDPLVFAMDSDPARWQWLFAAPHGARRPIGPSWMHWLDQAQDHRCFWCHQPLTASTATVEHVLPYGDAWWPRLTRLEQLLSLRRSHAVCNAGYNTWRQHQSTDTLAQMDAMLVRHIRQQIHRHPLLMLSHYHHYTPLAQ